MKIKFQHKIAFALALGFVTANAQKKDENLGTEVVNVVKPYTPTISDAFKVKETPVIEDEDNTQTEEIKYNIFSFPVASVFTPAKGKAAGVEKPQREKLFNNYATLGVGNYGTVNAELFVTENLSRNAYAGAMLRHLSSQGGIDEVVLDDKYYNTAIDLTYGNRQKNFSWTADLGYQNQVYNWYGLPVGTVDFAEGTAGSIDEKQTYNTFYIAGNIGVKESFFRDAAVQYKRFGDAFGSGENRFFIKPVFDIDVFDQKVKVDVVADYVGGTFENDYTNTITDIKYSHINLGIQPSFIYQQEDLSLQVGAGVFYTSGKMMEETEGSIHVYPQVKASYKLVGDIMVAYAGAEGTLRQNSYADFVSGNPFVSPTLLIMPTDQKYDVYAGLKGKLTNTVAYNIRGSYLNENDRALYRNNALISEANTEGYAYGNSFGIVYDNVKTISFFGEIKADLSKNVTFGVNSTFNSFKTDNEAEAWNLPQIRVGADLDVAITEKWYAGTNLFFVGERKDVLSTNSSLVTGPDTNFIITDNVVDLKSFFDINAHVGYRYSERLTGFLRLNNIASQDYQRWVNYPVQGFQALLGASYKFNF